MNNKITWASIVPLIGGESIGLMNAFGGQFPEYVLSYKAFVNNDAHFISYLRKKGWNGEYILLDDTDAEKKLSKINLKVDVVNSVCPCAGLSSLIKKPQSGCPANDWMYKTTEFILDRVKPAVLWGENAPKFSTNVGKPVRDKIREMAKEAGYSFSVYYTSSVKHGTPQNRCRSFYFLWNTKTAPVMDWHDEINSGYLEQLGKPIENDILNVPVNPKKIKPTESPWYKYLLEKLNMTHAEYCKSLDRDVCAIWEVAGGHNKHLADWSDFIEWCDKHGYDKESTRASYMQTKINDAKNIWAKELILMNPNGNTPAFVAIAPTDWVHPVEDRYLTIRECLRIMGLPDDFDLLGGRKNINHICQNVIVKTSTDIAKQVLKFIRSDLPMSPHDFLLQNNMKQITQYEYSNKMEIYTHNNASLEAFI